MGCYAGAELADFRAKYAALLALLNDHSQTISILLPLVQDADSKLSAVRVPEAKATLVRAYLCSGNIDKARFWLSQVPQSNFDVTALHGVIELIDGNHKQGQEMLRRLVDNLPAKTVLENAQYLGDLLLQTGQYEACETLCQRQLRSFPMAPALLLRLAQCSCEQGKFTRSEEFCNRTLTIPLREHLLYDSSMLMTKLMHRKKDLLRAKCYARIALPLAQLKYGKEEGDILYLRRVLQIGGT